MMNQSEKDRHNAMASEVWAAFNAGQPIRPPMTLTTATQFFIANDDLNPGEQVTFESYSTDGQVMLDLLCGNGTRHFKTLRDEVGVYDFETGFPVDFGWLGQELGPDVLIHGGPDIMLLRDGTRKSVAAETRRILDSGICAGRFVLAEGNNLAPGTPCVNLAAMYAVAQQGPTRP